MRTPPCRRGCERPSPTTRQQARRGGRSRRRSSRPTRRCSAALRGHDRRTIAKILVPSPARISATARGPVTVLDRRPRARPRRRLGPAQRRLLRSIDGGFETGDRLVAVRGSRVVAGATGTLTLVPGRAARVRLGATDYRGLADARRCPDGVAFAALTPQQRSTRRRAASERTVIAALLASLAALRRSSPTCSAARSCARCAGSSTRRTRSRAGRLGERVDVRGRDEFAQLGSAFNRMAAQLELRLAELETERSRVREATAPVRRGARRDPRSRAARAASSSSRPSRRRAPPAGVVLRPARRARARSASPTTARSGSRSRCASARPISARSCSPADAFEAEQVETAASSPRRPSSRSRTRGCTASSSGRRWSTASPGSPTAAASRRRCAPSSRARRASATRVCARARRPRRLQAGQRPLRPSRRRRGPEGVRAGARARRCARATSPARWGGEEFALVLPGTDAAGGARLAERARAATRGASRSRCRTASRARSLPASASPRSRTADELGELARGGRFGALRGQGSGQEPGRGRGRVDPPLNRLDSRAGRVMASEQEDFMAVDTPSMFAQVIQEHLELKRRNAALEHEMPLEQVHERRSVREPSALQDRGAGADRGHDGRRPGRSRPRRPRSTGRRPRTRSSTPPAAGPGRPEETEEASGEPDQPSDENLWSRSRDFDWGD